jgi:A/G-specific adenine glycosylase
MTPLAKNLLRWYQKNRILYPWRKTQDPYKIWLSEILLQQTRIPVVLKYYDKILQRFPQIEDLSRERESEFLALWSGLGYYKRAHAMLECAHEIMHKYHGRFPSALEELLKLPGIGNYTAGAIRNVCFKKLTPSLDGNIRRVLSRLAMKHNGLEEFFLKIGTGADAADFFQSLMELGEQICLPDPRCAVCPALSYCKARQNDKIAEFPRKKQKKKPETFHWYLLLAESNGAHYYVQNPNRAFLKQAWIFPDILSKNQINPATVAQKFRRTWGIHTRGLAERKTILHSVTFRKIRVHVMIAKTFDLNGLTGKWLREEDFHHHPTSSITGKTLQIKNAQMPPAKHPLK